MGNGTRRGWSGERRSQRTSDRSIECGERNPREAGSFNASYSPAHAELRRRTRAGHRGRGRSPRGLAADRGHVRGLGQAGQGRRVAEEGRPSGGPSLDCRGVVQHACVPTPRPAAPATWDCRRGVLPSTRPTPEEPERCAGVPPRRWRVRPTPRPPTPPGMEGSGSSATNSWRSSSENPASQRSGRSRQMASIRLPAETTSPARYESSPRRHDTVAAGTANCRMDYGPCSPAGGGRPRYHARASIRAGDSQERPRRRSCEPLDRILRSRQPSQTLVVRPVRPDGHLRA